MILLSLKKPVVLFLSLLFYVSLLNAQNNTLKQYGAKLVGSKDIGPFGSYMGYSAAISGDGNTVIGGGIGYNNLEGAVWVYTRVNGSWITQKMLLPQAEGVVNSGHMGNSTSLSYDGNTALIGAYNDEGATGAAYIFTRSLGIWTYQTRLIGTPHLGGYGVQGFSVSLSGDGNTAIVGAYGDNNTFGAAYVYTNSNGTWVQQAKLTDINAVYATKFGLSVALDYDGNTAAIGESDENGTRVGSALVYARSGNVWTQQIKLNHAGTGHSIFTESSAVAINSDGSKVVLGTPGYANNKGAVWVFSKNNNVWSQQNMLIASDNSGAASQGAAVSISGNGKKILVGGPYDNNSFGATWEYSDLGSGFIQNGKKLIGTGVVGTYPPPYQGCGIGLSSDGNTSVIGAFGDNNYQGALWIFAGSSTDPTLTNVTLSSGTITPSFSSANLSYSTTVGNAVSSITLTATAADASSVIKVNGTVLTNGSPSGAISLDVGNNTISILVTASDGTTTKTYTVIINRLEPPPVASVTAGGPVIFCNPGLVALTASTSTYTWTYQWLLNGSAISGATATTYTATQSGSYSVVVTNGNGQSVTSAATVVKANPLPLVTASNNGPFISGDPNSLSLSASGATSYSWTDNNGVISPALIDHVTTANAGLYSVIGTDLNGCTNRATTTVVVNTRPAGALNFDGNAHMGYVKVAHPFTDFKNEITVEWSGNIDPASSIGSGPGQSLENVDGVNSLVWLMHYYPNNRTLQFYISDNGTWKHVDAPVPNGWHKYVGVASAKGMQIYVDGVLINSSANGITGNIVSVPNAVLEIGKDSRWNNRFYKGDVDEVRVWNRALCQAEITNNQQGEINIPNNGLQEYYKFNQGNAQDVNTGLTTLPDASGNGRDGTLYNFGNLTGPTLNWTDGYVTGLSPAYVAPVPSISGVNIYIQRSTSPTSCTAVGNYYGGNNSLAINNADNITYIFTGQTTGTGSGTGSDQLFNQGVTNVTITAANACGSVSTNFTVTVVDDVKPVALTKNITVYLDQNGNTTVTPQQIDNGSYDNCTSPVNLSINNSGKICATAAEGSTATLQAPMGALITSIDFASYGTPTGTCGSFSKGWCDASSTLGIVTNGAVGQNSYSVGALNQIFGDPCGGTVKHLYIQGTYKSATGVTSTFDCSNVGPNTVTLTVKDAAGNVSTADAIVTVVDNIAPTVKVKPATIYLDANGAASITTASVDGGSFDNCSFTLSLDKSTFNCSNVGTNQVTLTAKDASGNSTSLTTSVNVLDTIKPVLTVPADLTVNCSDNMSPSSTGTAIATDNCSALVNYADVSTQSIDVNAYAHYNYNITRTWTATDPSNNTTNALQTITVQDITPPTISVPGNVTLNCQDDNSSNKTGVATGTDNCGPVTITQSEVSTQDASPTSAAHYNYTITRTWTATDVSGNHTNGVQTITVQDVTPPQLTIPADITVNNDKGNCYATVAFTATGTDNCSPLNITYSKQPGTSFGVGTSTINVSATDVTGNVSKGSFTIIVIDNEKPVITSNGIKSVNNDASLCGALVIVNATATDNCGVGTPTGVRSDGLALNALYPVGKTTITWNVTDIHNNAAEPVTQTIEVTDNEKPTITTTDVAVNNDDGKCSASITLAAPVVKDNCGTTPPVGVRSDVQSLNAPYPVGTTTIAWTETDIHGNIASTTQTVVVTDNEKPTISTTDVTVNNDKGVCAATIALATPVTKDNCGVQSVTNDHASTSYAVGTTIVNWTVTDTHGNTASTTQSVTVTDNEVPVITASVNQSVNNDAGTCGALVNMTATAKDNCGVGSPVGIRSDGLSLLAAYPVGTTTITWNVTDIHGNAAVPVSRTVTVADNEAPVVRTKNISVTLVGGTVSITAAQVDNGSTDNCGIASRTVSPSTFVCGQYGNNTVTLTVTDIHGNISSATAVVTVIGVKPLPSIAISRTDNTFTGLSANTIALGYGTQNLTLKATDGSQVTAGTTTYVWSSANGLSGLSSTTSANPVFTPTTAGNYTFTVTATNQYGCVNTTSVMITVVDVRCGNKNDKVIVCHKTGSSSNPTVEICISPNAVATQLSKGDNLGHCPYTFAKTSSIQAGEEVKKSDLPKELTVSAAPNPTNTFFKLTITSNDLKTSATVRVVDASGRPLQQFNQVIIGSSVSFGHTFTAGSYYAEVSQGTQHKVIKLIKMK